MSASSLTLDNHTRAELSYWLDRGEWVIACLCAAWCDTCRAYRASFDQLAALHPDKRFVWIDIEDQADLIGDIDVENFPTILIQRKDAVAFFGTVLPDIKIADRLIVAQTEKTDADLHRELTTSPERAEWQRLCNLRTCLDATN